MKDYDPQRRQFLRLLISLSMASVLGWNLDRYESLVYARTLTPEESLKKLILLLGPWPSTDNKKAEAFARRFLKSKHAVGPYLPGLSNLLQSLASRFPDGILAIKKIDLRGLPAKENELLMNLVGHLYSLVEVRFDVSNWPPYGECQDDTTWYTRAPMLRKM